MRVKTGNLYVPAQVEPLLVALQDIMERAEFECEKRRANKEYLGQWRIVEKLARDALKRCPRTLAKAAT